MYCIVYAFTGADDALAATVTCRVYYFFIFISRYCNTMANLGVENYHNKKVWMTTAIFQTWLTNWNHDLRWMQCNCNVLFNYQQCIQLCQEWPKQHQNPVYTTKYNFQTTAHGSSSVQINQMLLQNQADRKAPGSYQRGSNFQRNSKRNWFEGHNGHADGILEQHSTQPHWELILPCLIYPGPCYHTNTRARYLELGALINFIHVQYCIVCSFSLQVQIQM